MIFLGKRPEKYLIVLGNGRLKVKLKKSLDEIFSGSNHQNQIELIILCTVLSTIVTHQILRN